jgi:hypothetical protein
VVTSQPVSRAGSAPVTTQTSPATPSAPVWDELAQLINRNLMAAAVTNAQHLGLDLTALQTGALAYTPRPRDGQTIPASLTQVELQHQVPHDPIIDTIPHPRLRFNILRAIATRQLDGEQLSRCIRGSGSFEISNGSRERFGLVVWSAAEQLASWEVSEAFFTKHPTLLQGCEDLIAATNVWRTRRGERPFELRFGSA